SHGHSRGHHNRTNALLHCILHFLFPSPWKRMTGRHLRGRDYRGGVYKFTRMRVHVETTYIEGQSAGATFVDMVSDCGSLIVRFAVISANSSSDAACVPPQRITASPSGSSQRQRRRSTIVGPSTSTRLGAC